MVTIMILCCTFEGHDEPIGSWVFELMQTDANCEEEAFRSTLDLVVTYEGITNS